MAKVSTHLKTLKFLLDSGERGVSVDDLSSLGIHLVTFYRHRRKINSSTDYFVESYKNENGELRYRIQQNDNRQRSKFTWYGSTEHIYPMQERGLEDSESMIFELPIAEKGFLDSEKWKPLCESIDDSRPILVKKYECPVWEKFKDEEILILPKSVFVYADSYYLQGIWIDGNVGTNVFLSMHGVIEYSRVRPHANISKISQIKASRWDEVWIGVRKLTRRIKSEMWHSQQMDFNTRDQLVEYGSGWSSKFAKKILESFSFVRCIPNANEITMMKIHYCGNDAKIVKPK